MIDSIDSLVYNSNLSTSDFLNKFSLVLKELKINVSDNYNGDWTHIRTLCDNCHGSGSYDLMLDNKSLKELNSLIINITSDQVDSEGAVIDKKVIDELNKTGKFAVVNVDGKPPNRLKVPCEHCEDGIIAIQIPSIIVDKIDFIHTTV